MHMLTSFLFLAYYLVLKIPVLVHSDGGLMTRRISISGVWTLCRVEIEAGNSSSHLLDESLFENTVQS